MSLYESPATSSHFTYSNLSTPAFSEDFEAPEPALPIIHARGLTQPPAPDFKPYVYGASSRRAQMEVQRAAQNFGRFTNP